MFEINRGQLLIYAAVAAAIIAVGLFSLRKSRNQAATQAAAVPGRSADPAADDNAFRIGGGSRRLVVDVSGAVIRPGVYRLPDGSRVIDAIRRAGGPSGRAMVAGINRAAALADGQQVVVPARLPVADRPGGTAGAATTAEAAGGGAGWSGAASGPVSLGTATAVQLEEIDGIGPVTAQKIVEFRDSRGGLSSVEDLDQVSGIGPVTMESLRSALQP